MRLDPAMPLGRQVEAEVRRLIRSGGLAAGAALPSTRALAADLELSRGVIVGAYAQLAAEGYLVTRRGAAPVVASLPFETEPPFEQDVHVAAARFNLRPDLPDLALFPRAAWLSASRTAMRAAADTDLAYGEPFGSVRASAAVGAVSRATRGTVGGHDRIGVYAGSTHALFTLANVLRMNGAKRLGVEDPGHRWRTATLAASGLEIVPVPVDHEGLRTDRLDGLDAVVVSPEHSFPLGLTLSPERRRALVQWAVANDTIVIEHDYDGHFRYDRAPTAALQALAPEHVAYVGTASAILAPTIRLGWSVLPSRLVEESPASRRGTSSRCRGWSSWRSQSSSRAAISIASCAGRAVRTRSVETSSPQHFPSAGRRAGSSSISHSNRQPTRRGSRRGAIGGLRARRRASERDREVEPGLVHRLRSLLRAHLAQSADETSRAPRFTLAMPYRRAAARCDAPSATRCGPRARSASRRRVPRASRRRTPPRGRARSRPPTKRRAPPPSPLSRSIRGSIRPTRRSPKTIGST